MWGGVLTPRRPAPLVGGGRGAGASCQQNSLYQVKAIVDKKDKMKRLVGGKRTGRACVHYKVKWAGAQWENHDTWEPLENLLAPRVKAMVSAFNAAKRVRRE